MQDPRDEAVGQDLDARKVVRKTGGLAHKIAPVSGAFSDAERTSAIRVGVLLHANAFESDTDRFV